MSQDSLAAGRTGWLLVAIATVAALAAVSVFVGVADASPLAVFEQGADGRAAMLIMASRVPRTVALLLTGIAMAVVGLLMQLLVRNRFVEPTTTGTAESATLGLLVITVFAPAMPLMGKMVVASVFAIAGTALFLLVLRAVPLRETVMVPLLGIMLGGVIGAITTFFAYRLDLLQTLGSWMTGDFSGVLRGRYELLWIALGMTAITCMAADRFSVAGLGRDVATTLGLRYGRVVALGLVIVAITTAVVIVTAGIVPFLGLVVPNIVSLIVGDNLRRAIPWVAVLGAGFMLVCDLIGRVIRFPYEIPLGFVVGVVGGVLFLWLLLRKGRHAR